MAPLHGQNNEQIILGRDFDWFLLLPGWTVEGGITAIRPFAAGAPSDTLAGPGFRLGTGLSPDGRHLLIASRPIANATNTPAATEHFQLWDLPEGRLESTWLHPKPGYHSPGPIEFSPDGRRVGAACFNRQGIELWDVEKGQRLAVYHPPITPSPKGRLRNTLRSFSGSQEGLDNGIPLC